MTAVAASAFPIFASAAAATKQPLIVSVHDVAPATRDRSAEIVRELGRHGVDACSLLVVPDYHRSGASMENREFVRWLREMECAGNEVVIHGYFHQRPRRTGETMRQHILTRAYTRDEGEFYDLDYAEALRRITRARDDFTAAGLSPRGFIAPAWLLGAEAQCAAADAELEYTTTLTSVADLRTQRSFHARSLVYSVRSGWRRTVSLSWNALLAQLQSTAELVRLGIHPPDADHPQIWRQFLGLAVWLAAERTPTTYCDWIEEQRLDTGCDSAMR